MIDDATAIVVIGRNEGERLRRCLTSASEFGVRVYVDSGSTDGSQQLARDLGFTVLALDGSGFTAAKARNQGIFFIAEHHPEIEFVQTIDGDCEFVPDWLATAISTMRCVSEIAVVFGRRRERFPERNIYHVACDIEWEVAVGDVSSCGGDAVFRMAALLSAGGYNPTLIAGEEPDLCFRMRRKGWRIRSDGRDMTLHDVDITTFGQWWQRAKRAGHGIAELTYIHARAGAERSWRQFLASAAFWSAVMLMSVASLLAGLVFDPLALKIVGGFLACICVLQVIRVAVKARALRSAPLALQWSALLFLSKLAQSQGALIYVFRRRRPSGPSLIEYK